MSSVPAAYPRRNLALGIALGADALQWIILPFFAAVIPAVLDDVLDVVIAFVMIRLLGWHFAFLPTALAELVPGVNLLPTWTAAVWFVTRKGRVKSPPESPPPLLPPSPPALP